MATMTRSRLADRLKSLGISCGQFDVYCEFKSDTTRNALRRDSFTDVPELADEKLNELEDEQERLTLAATDVVLTDLEEGKDNLIFVPYFQNFRTYARAGYMQAYGPYIRFEADLACIVERLRFVDQNIMCFTPDNPDYTNGDVFAGYGKNVNKVIVDPLRLRKELNLHLGAYRLSREAIRQRTHEESLPIQEAIVSEIDEYMHSNNGVAPREVLVPVYLAARDLAKRHIDARSGVPCYNGAVVRAIEELETQETIKEKQCDLRLCCLPQEPHDPREGVLFVDVPRMVYGSAA